MLLVFVRRDSSSTRPELIFPFEAKSMEIILPIVPCILRLSSLAVGNRPNSWLWARAGSVPSNPLECVFWLQVLRSRTPAGHFRLNPLRGAFADLGRFLSAALTSLDSVP